MSARLKTTGQKRSPKWRCALTHYGEIASFFLHAFLTCGKLDVAYSTTRVQRLSSICIVGSTWCILVKKWNVNTKRMGKYDLLHSIPHSTPTLFSGAPHGFSFVIPWRFIRQSLWTHSLQSSCMWHQTVKKYKGIPKSNITILLALTIFVCLELCYVGFSMFCNFQKTYPQHN